MASLIDELISTLEEENRIYTELIPIEDEKTRVIIKNDLTALQEITGKEQDVIDKIGVLERKREEVIMNIGTVLGRKREELGVRNLVKIMGKQPDIARRLSLAHDNLSTTVKRLVNVNNRNKVLIEQSLEMIDFDMNLLQSMKTAPGVNNYNTRGMAQDMSSAYRVGSFDAKQ